MIEVEIEVGVEVEVEGARRRQGVGSGGQPRGVRTGRRWRSCSGAAGRPRGVGPGPSRPPGGVGARRRAPAPGVGLWLAVALFAVPAGLGAQDARAALGVDTALVGDVVPVVVRVPLAEGERVLWPDTLPLEGATLENAARVRAWADTLDDGSLAGTAAFAVTPWRTGELALPEVRLQVVGGEESPREVQLELPPLTVASVLPPDTAGVQPRPPRDVLGANWAWARIIALLLLAAAVLAGLLVWWRRRKPKEQALATPEPRVPPRERALALLREARDAGLLERGEMKEFYTRISLAVRGYAAALEPAWGEDLTTTELLGRFRTQVGIQPASDLRRVLAPADQVKFARRVPDPGTAAAEWEAARSWVAGFDWPPPIPVTEEAA